MPMSRFSYLEQHLVGMSDEEVAERWRDTDAVQAGEIIQNQKKRVVDHVLKELEERAVKGDLASLEWLEERGLIALPTKTKAVPTEQRDMAIKVLKAVFDKAEDGELEAVKWLAARELIDLPGKADE